MHRRLPTAPEVAIYNALAETVSVGLLKWVTCARALDVSGRFSRSWAEVLSDGERAEELEWVASRMVASLNRQGYRITRKGG